MEIYTFPRLDRVMTGTTCKGKIIYDSHPHVFMMYSKEVMIFILSFMLSLRGGHRHMDFFLGIFFVVFFLLIKY